MSSGPQPCVALASSAQAAAARRLVLTPAQVIYAGDIAFNVDNAMAAPDSDAMVVLLDATVVGFYRLDYPTAPRRRQIVDRHTATLRALALDVDWQGRGLGLPMLLACIADLRQRHPERRLLALNVHAANTVALHVYARAGFVDSGQTLPGGRGGPQRLLVRALDME